MHLQVFRLPDHAAACSVARGLQREGLTTRAGVRHHLAYLTVRSDRPDVSGLVRGLEPAAVPVHVEHLPRGAAELNVGERHVSDAGRV